MNTFEPFKELAQTRRRRLANNTYLIIRDDGGFGIKLHETEVVIHYPDRIILNSGGYQTVTTKDRMNRFSTAQVWSDKGVWLVAWASYRKDVPFADNMILHHSGSIVGAGPNPKATQKLRKRINQFAKDYATAFCTGKVPAPSGGDCWPCCMVTKDGKSAMGSDHILSHLDENYFVPSMLNRMMSNKTEHFGYIDHMFSLIDKDYIGRTWSPDHQQPDSDYGGITQKRIHKAIRKFCFHELGLAT